MCVASIQSHSCTSEWLLGEGTLSPSCHKQQFLCSVDLVCSAGLALILSGIRFYSVRLRTARDTETGVIIGFDGRHDLLESDFGFGFASRFRHVDTPV